MLIGSMIIMTIRKKFSVIGIGYVGLPLAVELSKSNNVLGFDINQNRINNLKRGIDITKEFTKNQIKSKKNLNF